VDQVFAFKTVLTAGEPQINVAAVVSDGSFAPQVLAGQGCWEPIRSENAKVPKNMLFRI